MQADRLEDASAELVRSAEVAMETMVVEVTLSKDLFAMLGYSKSRAEEAIKEFSVLGLYLEQRISVGKAAELLGVRKREFVRLLSRRGIPYLDYTDEELDEEFRAVDEWKSETG
jgi:predicted HTH domain antitoxin